MYWNKKISKINLRNLFSLLEKKKGKKNGAEIGNGLLPIEHEAGRGRRMGAGLGVLGAGLGRSARAGKHCRRAWALGVARRQACVGARASAGRRQQRAQRARGRARRRWGAGARVAGGLQARGRWQARGHGQTRSGVGWRGARGRRTLGRRAGRARQGAAASAGARGAHGAGLAWRWARGLALGCALGALGLFLARFDSVFS